MEESRQGYKIVDRAFLKLLKDTSKHEHVIIESNNKGKWVIAVKKGLVLTTAGLLQDWIMKNSSKILESSLCFWDILWWYNMALKYGTILRHDNVALSFFNDDVFQEQSGIIIFYFVTYHRTLASYFVFQTCDHSLFPKQIHKCFSVIQNLVLLLQFHSCWGNTFYKPLPICSYFPCYFPTLSFPPLSLFSLPFSLFPHFIIFNFLLLFSQPTFFSSFWPFSYILHCLSLLYFSLPHALTFLPAFFILPPHYLTFSFCSLILLSSLPSDPSPT